MKSVPGSICISIRAVRRMSEWEKLWSLPEATSRPSMAASRFSASTSRMPEGTAPTRPMQLMDPFWVPCTPPPLIISRQRASR